MKISAFRCACENCEQSSLCPVLSDFDYGSFVLGTQVVGEFAYLDAVANTSFDEVSRIVDAHPKIAPLPDSQRAVVIQGAFTVACDLSPSGSQYCIGLELACRSCGSRNMEIWSHVDPVSHIDVPEVSHVRWNALSDEQKIDTVHDFLKDRDGIED